MDTTTAAPSPPTKKQPGTANFLSKYWPRLLAISIAVLTPCLWHEHIEAGDLGSHVYNAWLAHLIETGQAPGLYIAHQWNNILFDVLLEHAAPIVGFSAAERLVTSLAVLIFFWGAFALVYAMATEAERRSQLGKDMASKAVQNTPGEPVQSATQKAIQHHAGDAREPAPLPWLVLPLLAIFAYGYTFEMGFLNFYISLGLAFAALALLLRGSAGFESSGRISWHWLAALLLCPFIWLAHPLGMALLVAAGAYLLLARRLPVPGQAFLFAASALLIVAARFYIVSHYVISWRAGQPVIGDGTDQLLIYGRHYLFPARALELFACGALLWDAFTRRSVAARNAAHEAPHGANGTAVSGPVRQWWSPYLLPLQLYALALLTAWLLPSVIRVPQYAAPLGLLTQRLTSVSAVLLCCLLAAMRPRKWHLACAAILCAVFFLFLYRDTAKINRMEDQAAHYMRLLPPGQRILTTILPFPGARVFMDHMVDRACVGWCFSYENYEPSSLQFRVRVNPGTGNPMVMSSAADADAAEGGNYVLNEKDLQAYQIYQCDLTMTALCMRELTAGETNGRIGLHLKPR